MLRHRKFLLLGILLTTLFTCAAKADSSDIVINEIMYHPFHAVNFPEDTGAEYIELFNCGAEAVNLYGWRLNNGIDFVFSDDISLGAGDYLVIASDIVTFGDLYPDIYNVIGGWEGHLSNSGEKIELIDDNGTTIDTLVYADQGDWAMRELGPLDHEHRGWQWSNSHDGGGKSLELINPSISNKYGQNWSASLADLGTPGQANSVYNSDIAPLILDLQHSPAIPGPGEVVTVTAKIIDEQSSGISVRLYYRIDTSSYQGENIYPYHDPADYDIVPMFDDGAHNDGNAGDNIYGAQLPARPEGTIIEFFVEAEDISGNFRTWPAPSMMDEIPEQVTNALYQVNGEFDFETWIPGSRPVYLVIMTEAERGRLEDIGDDGDPWSGEGATNARMNATFISADGVDIKLRYSVGIRNRGNQTRTRPAYSPMNYRVNFPSDHPWKDVTAINLNSKYPHLQLAGSVLFRLAGLPAPVATAVQLRINGDNLALIDSDTYGSYVALEAYDNDWAENHFPDDSSGNLYRCTYVYLPDGSRIYADLYYKESPGSTPNPDDYQGNYPKHTNISQYDYSDLFDLIDKLNNPAIPDEQFVSQLGTAVNIEQWLRYIAFDSLVGNKEGGLATGKGDDYAMYRGIADPRFVLLPHDLDTILGFSYEPDRDILIYENVAGLYRLLNHPEITRLYYRQHKDLAETFFTPENIYPVIDQILGDWVPASEISGSHGIQEYIVDRINSVIYGGYPDADSSPQIPQEFTIYCDLPSFNGLYVTNTNVLGSRYISGTANAIETDSVTVNGTQADWSQKYGLWSPNEDIPLNPGINRIFVRTYDGSHGDGTELDCKYIDVWYDTGFTNDYPKNTSTDDSDTTILPDTEPEPTLNIITRDSYLPGVPVLVRIEILSDEGEVERDIWDAAANLSVDNPGVNLSTDRVVLYNGLGSALVTFTGSGNFTLSADVMGMHAEKSLADWSNQPVNVASGALDNSDTWSGIYHITGGDFSIPDGVTLTINPGTLILIDGVPSGENGTDINVEGAIQSLGTGESPITFTAYPAGQNWGKLYHHDAEPSVFQYTNITRAGHSPRMGHSNSGPAIHASNSAFTFDHANLTDNAGKLMDITSGCDLTFYNCLFARSVMGPEISGSAILFENGWITDMQSDDDGDGIYIHSQQAGQICTLRSGVSVGMDDDGIDLLEGDVTIEDFIVRDCKDKGISVYGGSTNINHCLVVENNKAPEDPTVASIAAKAREAESTTVNIDHTTIVTSKIDGYVDIGIQSHNKYGVLSGTIIYNITNSIIDATDPVDVQAPYLESDIHINYSNIFGETWPGTNNINNYPLFVDSANHDYRLKPVSPCIDAGDPSAEPDPDMTITDQGYFFFDRNAAQESLNGTLTEDTIWTAGEGPYRITGELTIASETTLTIMPGTSVFFEPDAKIIIKGILIAEGSQNELIRFTRTPETFGTWNGLQFIDTASDNRITYAVLEYGQNDNGMICLENSRLLIDNVTFDNSSLWRIRTVDSSLAVRNSTFTDTVAPGQAPTDNRTEHIWGSGIMSNGELVIENNVFGVTPGHNDAIDFDRAERPGPILQILNNQFTGGGDEALDLEADAHIEGNVFMHYHEDVYNTDAGESNVISLGRGKDITLVRNIFYDVDHVILVKEDSFVTFVNNTVVNVDKSAIYFDLPGQTGGPGLGAYVDSCIFKNSNLVFDQIGTSTQLSVTKSIIPSDWHYLGIDNIDADPLFVDEQEDFHLKPDSAAIEAGSWGLDIGALVAAGAAISGEPGPVTYHRDAWLTVGGPGITHYKYSLNNPAGPWSQELSVDVPIELNNLYNKNSYTVYAVGKNSAGIWQNIDQSTASKTWTIDTSYVELAINEILANTIEPESDMIELYYDGPAPLDLTDMSLTDNPDQPRKFVFSSQNLINTAMQPGDYMVLYADHNVYAKNHIGFALGLEGEGLYLYDKPANGGSLIDYVEFGPQIQDYSIGRTGYDRRWKLNSPTFGQPNIAQPLGDPDKLKINEWLADGEVLFDNDFIELYNPNPLPVKLGGLYLTDNPVTQLSKNKLAPLSFIGPEGYAVFKANNGDKPSELNFKLSPDGEIIGLFDENANLIDQVIYGPQTTDFSQGRYPDGSNHYEFIELPTPGVANTFFDTITIERTLVPEDADKRVLVPDGPVDDSWKESETFDDSDWMLCTGEPGGVGYERSSDYEHLISLDIEELMYNNNTTCYIRIPFTFENDPADFNSMTLKMRYDDGFIAYINGTEAAGENYTGAETWDSDATANHESDGTDFDVEIDITEYINQLRYGDNILAIHGLNVNTTSSDFIISAELNVTSTAPAQEYVLQDYPDVLAGLRVTELMYHAPGGERFDYIELQNISGVPIGLNGVRITGGIDFTFPDMQLGAGEYVLVVSDITAFAGANINIAGEYEGRLSNSSEEIVVKLALPLDAAILRFSYSDQWYPATDGQGQSLEIIDPAAPPATWNEPSSWQSGFPNPGGS